MAHIALGVDKASLTYQKSQLEFQEMLLSQDLNKLTREMADITEEHQGDDDYDPDSDLELKELQYQQQIYDSEKASIESQLKDLNAEVESFGKAEDTNIKSESKFTIST